MAVCLECFGPLVLSVDRNRTFCCKCNDARDVRDSRADATRYHKLRAKAWVDVDGDFFRRVIEPHGTWEDCFNKEQIDIIASTVDAWVFRIYTFAYAEALARFVEHPNFPSPDTRTSDRIRNRGMWYITDIEEKVNQIVSDRTRAGEGAIVQRLQKTWYGTKFRDSFGTG